MAVGKGKGKTQSAKIASSAKVQSFNLATSYECENCKDKCSAGIKYIDRVAKRHFGKGVRCPKK